MSESRPTLRLLTLAVILCLAACGKRGNPVAPGPADQIVYPKTYPVSQ
jgi:predicted small lipoprotein YifL